MKKPPMKKRPMEKRPLKRPLKTRPAWLRQGLDRLAGVLIPWTGIGVASFVLAIFAYLLFMAWPLFTAPSFPWEGAEGTLWQSSAGGAEFGPRLSLLPLLLGTFKALFYALLFGAPLAFGAALYLSHFAPPPLRQVLKPLLELSASIPAVALGFIGASLLAPWLERHLLLLLLFLLGFPLTLFGLGIFLPTRRVRRHPALLLFLGLALSLSFFLVLGFRLEALVEERIFGAPLSAFLETRFGLRYEQRNGLLIGILLGFAVLPSIFTLADHALSRVPAEYLDAARSLGASEWQVVARVALRVAAPGLVAALLIGISRAMGETLIVLMASGNAPLLDLGPFTGMRTLPATLAIELPEASEGETLFRVLFLAGALLFLFTFSLNLLADWAVQILNRRLRRP